MYVGQKVGPFLIEKELGSGAMGQVYKASFDKDGKPVVVALKVVALGLLGNDSAMARFEREASILKQLRHPHIVRLIATGKFGKSHPAPFIAMEFVDGEPLDRVLTRRGRLGWEEVLTYMKQLCAALQYAHDKGIIHRDLKPSNLMITKDSVLKLTDFGIAKDTDVTALTAQNSTIGTAAYMSPEQCRGERTLSAKSDLYSLGVVLFELITGRKPFTAESTVDMFLKHVNEKPPRPTRFIPDLPVWMDNLIMFLLEKDANTRPMDAGTVKRMLEDIEQKVQAQASAGAEFANARRVDRAAKLSDIDEADLEAARAIRQASQGPKKAKKKKVVPLFQRQWVRALPLIAILLSMLGGGVYLLLPGKKPDFTESLAALKAAKNDTEKLELADALLKRTGLPDDVLAEAKRVRREGRGERLERIFAKRFKNRDGGLKFDKAQENEDEKAYESAWAALEAEDKGELKKATELWHKVKVREDEISDQYANGWGWLAEKHLKLLKKVETTVGELRDSLQQDELNEKPWKFDAKDPEAVARYAVRLGLLPEIKIEMPGQIQRVIDPTKSRRMFAELVDLAKDQPEHRLWYLLGIRERGTNFDPKSDDPAKRTEKVQKMFAEVQALWATAKGDPDANLAKRSCRIRVRDVIELYGDETDPKMRQLVDDAKKLLTEMMPKS